MAQNKNNYKERKNRKIRLVVTILIFLLLSTFCITKYFTLSKDTYTSYNEKSDVDYKVYLKDNTFFDDKYVEKNNQYIASLINYIDTTFNYNLLFPDVATSFDYSYKIVATTEVINKSNKNYLYKHSDDLYVSNTIHASNNININKNLSLDYDKYNSTIKKFISMYDLDEITSNLVVSLYVDILSDNNAIDKKKEAVAELTIPLTTKTIAIDMNSSTNDTKDNKLLVKNEGNYLPLLIIGIISFIIGVVYAVTSIIYLIKTQSALSIYRRNIKKILSSYAPDIQVIDSEYKIGSSQVIKINSFDDMLEIKDTTKSPLLMLENQAKTGAFFIIQTNLSVIYTYAYRVEDIIAKKNKEKAPDYDIKKINKELREKKYTKEFIDKQLTETLNIGAIDGENAISGNKDRDENIYDQLEKTTNYELLDFKKTEKKKKKVNNK